MPVILWSQTCRQTETKPILFFHAEIAETMRNKNGLIICEKRRGARYACATIRMGSRNIVCALLRKRETFSPDIHKKNETESL
jgi:hypothetical protein